MRVCTSVYVCVYTGSAGGTGRTVGACMEPSDRRHHSLPVRCTGKSHTHIHTHTLLSMALHSPVATTGTQYTTNRWLGSCDVYVRIVP